MLGEGGFGVAETDGDGVGVVDFAGGVDLVADDETPLSLLLNSESSPVCRCSHAFFR